MSSTEGWFCWQEPSGSYEIGVDDSVRNVGKSSGFVRSKKSIDGRFGSLMQKIAATFYKGKRIRFSAFVKCKGVSNSCGLFMEVFSSQGLLGIDNMCNRALKGDQDWSEHALILDVPQEALGINIGVRVVGPGQVWVDGVKFEEVGIDVALTDEMLELRYPTEPQNLDFAI